MSITFTSVWEENTIMKRLIAIILACLLAVSVFTGCKNEEQEELKGAKVSMYLTTLPESLDPAGFYTTQDDIRLMGLLYEGLTTVNEKGKLEKALAKDWEYDFNEKTGNLELLISLENSRWSDGNEVKAEDFRFAWQRILRPENNNPHSSLLYPVLNAQSAKEGYCSIDDVGIVCQDTKVLMITFDKNYVNEDDYSKGEIKDKVEYFLSRLASPALVPLRQDVVDDDTHEWCEKNGSSYVTNGPFKIKSWNSSELTFERNVNYRCVGDVEGTADDKIVKPYQIITFYESGATAEDQAAAYEKGEINYLNLNSASDETVKKYDKDIETENLYSTYCLYLDINNDTLGDAWVRQALSVALDREAIAKGVYGEPATGFVPTGIDDATAKTDFRKKGGDLISSKSNIDLALSYLEQAGVNPKGKIIAIDVSKTREDDIFIANKCKEAWEALGFVVRVNTVTQGYINSKRNGTYELDKNNKQGNIVFASVLAANLQSTTTDAYSVLTSFSGKYSGGAFDLRDEDFTYPSHVTGFNDPNYDAYCDAFVNAKNTKSRTTAMHNAESYLISQMPVIPVVFNNAYYVSQDLSKYETDGFGRLIFTELKLDTYDPDEERKALEAEKENK